MGTVWKHRHNFRRNLCVSRTAQNYFRPDLFFWHTNSSPQISIFFSYISITFYTKCISVTIMATPSHVSCCFCMYNRDIVGCALALKCPSIHLTGSSHLPKPWMIHSQKSLYLQKMHPCVQSSHPPLKTAAQTLCMPKLFI